MSSPPDSPAPDPRPVHRMVVRVYYEDTDLAGIVYYANHLKFIERGRSEWIESLGIDQMTLRDAGTVFAVRRITADYLAPAHFGDRLTVETRLAALRGARILVDQTLIRADGRVMFRAHVTLVCVGADGRARRLPGAVRTALAALSG